jgi:hypothetical protein
VKFLHNLENPKNTDTGWAKKRLQKMKKFHSVPQDKTEQQGVK